MILFVVVFLAILQNVALYSELSRVSSHLEERAFEKNIAAERLGEIYSQISHNYPWHNLHNLYRSPGQVFRTSPWNNTGHPTHYSVYRIGSPYSLGTPYGDDSAAQDARDLSFHVAKRSGSPPWSGEMTFRDDPFGGVGSLEASACPDRVYEANGFDNYFDGGYLWIHADEPFPSGRDYGPGANQEAMWSRDPHSDPGGFISGPQISSDWRLQRMFSTFSSGEWDIGYDHDYFDSLSPFVLNKVIGDSEANFRMGDLFSKEGVAGSAYSSLPANCAFVRNDGYRRHEQDLDVSIEDGTEFTDNPTYSRRGAFGVVRTTPDGALYWGEQQLEAISAARGLNLGAADTNGWIHTNLVERRFACDAACRAEELSWGNQDPNDPPVSLHDTGAYDSPAYPDGYLNYVDFATGFDPDQIPLVDSDGNYRLSLLSHERLRNICEDIFFPLDSIHGGRATERQDLCAWGAEGDPFDWSTFAPE